MGAWTRKCHLSKRNVAEGHRSDGSVYTVCSPRLPYAYGFLHVSLSAFFISNGTFLNTPNIFKFYLIHAF